MEKVKSRKVMSKETLSRNICMGIYILVTNEENRFSGRRFQDDIKWRRLRYRFL